MNRSNYGNQKLSKSSFLSLFFELSNSLGMAGLFFSKKYIKYLYKNIKAPILAQIIE